MILPTFCFALLAVHLVLALDKLECYTEIDNCRSEEYKQAYDNNDFAELCRTLPGYINCAERTNGNCTDTEAAAFIRTTFDDIRTSYRNCPNVTQAESG